MDMASISAALGSAKVILDLLKNVNDAQLAIRIGSEIANLQGRLIDVQQQSLSLQNENQQLRDQIKQVKRAIEDEKNFQFSNGVYWNFPDVLKRDEDGNQYLEPCWYGPFCPLCKDVDGKAVRLKNSGKSPNGRGNVWWCYVHDIEYEAPAME